MVVGVWAGNADDSPFQGNVIGITGAAPIWHSVIERAMGRCNVDTDQIPCGNYQSPFTQQRLFIIPPGVHQQSVSSFNGLAGSGIYDWMINGEDPQQSGLMTSSGSDGGNGDNNPIPTPTP